MYQQASSTAVSFGNSLFSEGEKKTPRRLINCHAVYLYVWCLCIISILSGRSHLAPASRLNSAAAMIRSVKTHSSLIWLLN